MVVVTTHAKKRMKERMGLQKKSLQRIADKAYNEGLLCEDTKGYLRKWASNKEHGNDVRIYGDKLFIFNDTGTLITVMHVPQKYAANPNYRKK